MPRISLPILLLLTACASQPASKPEVSDATGSVVGDAATAPARDLNLMRDEIPPVLQRAMKDAYAKPPLDGCVALAAELAELNAVLGEDFDSRDALQKDGNFASDLVVGAVRSLIPYRSVLRRISGAHERERRALAAIAAGGVRRAYLKGVGEQRGCAAPAAPRRQASTVETAADASD